MSLLELGLVLVLLIILSLSNTCATTRASIGISITSSTAPTTGGSNSTSITSNTVTQVGAASYCSLLYPTPLAAHWTASDQCARV